MLIAWDEHNTYQGFLLDVILACGEFLRHVASGSSGYLIS